MVTRVQLRPTPSDVPQPRYRRRRLTTLRQYRAFINRILLEMESGKKTKALGASLIWGARQGAAITREIQELDELRALRAQLAALQGSPTYSGLPLSEGVELLPAPSKEHAS